jgi:hypothetical protein
MGSTVDGLLFLPGAFPKCTLLVTVFTINDNHWIYGKLQIETELNVALYFQALRICISKFQKIQIEILEIANDVYYNGLKSQYKLLYILGYTKITNFDNFNSE